MTSTNPTNMRGDHRNSILSKTNLDNISNWYKQLHNKKAPDNHKWILKEHSSIVSKVIEKPGKYKDNSKKTFYSTLAKVIRLETGDTLDNPLFIMYSKKSTELAKVDETRREEQLLTEDEKKKWISFSELKKIVETNHSKMFDGDMSDMYKGLIACCYFYIPPIRVDLGDIHIWKKKTKLPKDKLNYMIKKDGLWVFVLREYKTYAKYGEAEVKTTKDLTELIDETLTEYPRKYLLTSVLDIRKPLGVSGLQKSITNIFGIGISTIRKIYGSHFYKLWGGRKSRMLELGKKMLHSSSTFYDHYLRFTDEEIADPPAESSRMAQERVEKGKNREIATQTTKGKEISTQTDKERLLGDRPFTPVEYSREYKKAHPEKARADAKKYFETHREDVLRSKLLRNLNRGMTSTPTQASITKYKLKKTSSGEWV